MPSCAIFSLYSGETVKLDQNQLLVVGVLTTAILTLPWKKSYTTLVETQEIVGDLSPFSTGDSDFASPPTAHHGDVTSTVSVFRGDRMAIFMETLGTLW